jgi:hypothetical protein
METGVVEAEDLTQATAVAKAYCQAHSSEHMTFAQVDGPLVLAGPEILEGGGARDQEPPEEPAAAPPAAPTPPARPKK